MRILQHGATGKPGGATVAQVTFSERGSFGAVSAAEQRGMPVFGPRGMAYRPCEGDNLLLLDADGSTVCAGALCAAEGLAPGELRLASPGGGLLYFRQDGSVVLNGWVFTKDGKMIPPEEEE